MAASFTVTLDTTAPASPSVVVNGGNPSSADPAVTLTIGTSDGDTTGYSMKIYGDVSDSAAPSEYRASEANAPWISFAGSKSVTLSASDGSKTVRVKIRDDVGNPSSEATDAITLDSSVPLVNITSGPSRTKMSKIATFDTLTFAFEVDQVFDEYKVKVVANSGAAHSTGTQIPTTADSTNVSGAAGGYAATTPITVTVKGADLESASAGDGAKVVKAFAKNATGTWSI